MGALLYGDHNLSFSLASSRQKLWLVYQPIHKSLLFGTTHTRYHKIVIHCKVCSYLEVSLYTCTKFGNKLYNTWNFGEALHSVGGPSREGRLTRMSMATQAHSGFPNTYTYGGNIPLCGLMASLGEGKVWRWQTWRWYEEWNWYLVNEPL